jgi:cell division septation protein DedD/predicted small lipoprotein YifL
MNRLETGVMIIILIALSGCGERGPQRLPDSGFQVAFESHKIATEMPSGQTVSADITVKNTSPVTWPSKPDGKDRYAVNLSYHWLDRKGATVVFDGLRTPLPRDLKPAESVDLKAAIQAPAKLGRYTLEVTLVQERSAWFPEKNGAKLVVPVNVVEASAAAENSAPVAAVATPLPAATQSEKTPAAEKTAKPQIQTVTKPNETAPSSDRGGSWSVQLGSYTEEKVAANLARKLKAKGYDAYVTVASLKGKEWHRVRVGRFEERGQAEKLRETLRRVEKLEHSIVTAR